MEHIDLNGMINQIQKFTDMQFKLIKQGLLKPTEDLEGWLERAQKLTDVFRELQEKYVLVESGVMGDNAINYYIFRVKDKKDAGYIPYSVFLVEKDYNFIKRDWWTDVTDKPTRKSIRIRLAEQLAKQMAPVEGWKVSGL